MNPNTTATREEYDNAIRLGFAVASTTGYQNYTLTFLAYSLASFTQGKPLSIDFAPIISDLVDPTSELYEFTPVLNSLGGIGQASTFLSDTLASLDHGKSIPTSREVLFIFLALMATFFVFIRLYTRFLVMATKATWDDITICIGLLLSYIDSVMVVYIIHHGGGAHIWDLSYEQLVLNMRLAYILQLVYYPRLFFIKLSILLFYHTLFPIWTFRWAIYAMIAFCTASTLGNTFALLFQCRPIAYWNHFFDAVCLDRRSMYFAGGILSIFTDFLILLLPMLVISTLHLKLRDRLSCMALFAVGGIVCVASILRLLTVYKIIASQDITYTECNSGTWTIVETDLGIICACAPSFKVLLRQCAPNLFQSTIATKKLSTIGSDGMPAFAPHSKIQDQEADPMDSIVSNYNPKGGEMYTGHALDDLRISGRKFSRMEVEDRRA